MLNFQDLYDTYVADVYRFALWLSGNRLEAEDITSETFVRAWTRHNSIRTETLKAYLLAIARNIYLMQRRKGKRQVALLDIHTDPTPEPEQVVEAQLELGRIQKLLQTIPEVDREAFILRVVHELPCAEIARILSISLTATKVKIHRVRKRLIASCHDKEIDDYGNHA
jgi:RNA polymerase sigma-70 factor (ECF subfamily)